MFEIGDRVASMDLIIKPMVASVPVASDIRLNLLIRTA